MAYRSLTLAAFACLALAGPALAGSVTECHGGWYGTGNGGWGPKRYIYECQATSESRYGTTQTTCNSQFGCVTTSEAKRQAHPSEPPKPIIEPSIEKDVRTGVTIMRGMPDR